MQKGVNCSSRIAQRALFTPLTACRSAGESQTPVRGTEQRRQTLEASRRHCRGAVVTSRLMLYSLAHLLQAPLPGDKSLCHHCNLLATLYTMFKADRGSIRSWRAVVREIRVCLSQV